MASAQPTQYGSRVESTAPIEEAPEGPRDPFPMGVRPMSDRVSDDAENGGQNDA